MGSEVIYALSDVQLVINDGEFIAVMGPSGSGKTTLANIIGGLDRPDSGEVIVDNQSLSRTRDKNLSIYRNKKVGFVFQTFNLQSGYTALENVMLPLILGRVPPKRRRRIAEECLRAVGLGDRMHHKSNQLSGGERQRTSIARALANDPEIIVADEPTGNLDSHTGAEIVELLRGLNRQRGITLIIITHDAGIAQYADRTISLRDGRIN